MTRGFPRSAQAGSVISPRFHKRSRWLVRHQPPRHELGTEPGGVLGCHRRRCADCGMDCSRTANNHSGHRRVVSSACHFGDRIADDRWLVIQQLAKEVIEGHGNDAVRCASRLRKVPQVLGRLPLADALSGEVELGLGTIRSGETRDGARRFRDGAGRHPTSA